MNTGLIVIGYFVLASFMVYQLGFFKDSGVRSAYRLIGFGLKCLAGIALWFLYTHVMDIERKDADIYRYYDDAVVISEAMDHSTSDYLALLSGSESQHLEGYKERMYNWDRSYSLIQLNDNRTMIRLHAVMALITGGDLLANSILFNLLAFIGLLYLFKGFRLLTDIPDHVFLWICILPPSLLFWGSGALKESLVLLPLGMSFYGLLAWYKNGSRWWLLGLGLILFVWVKPYVLLSFLPIVVYLVLRRLFSFSGLISAITTLGLVLLTLLISSFSDANDVVGILALKQKDFINLAEASQAGSMVDIPKFDGLGSFILQAPGAVLRTYLRPWLWEMRSMMDGMAALENAGYILLLLCAIVLRRKKLDTDVLVICLLFILAMGVLIGSVTPVLGAVVRYKVPALPFMLLLFYHMLDQQKLKTLFQRR